MYQRTVSHPSPGETHDGNFIPFFNLLGLIIPHASFLHYRMSFLQGRFRENSGSVIALNTEKGLIMILCFLSTSIRGLL